jgi:AraC-like DNA-binding protein
MYRISPVYGRIVARELERQGIDTTSLLTGTPLNRETLDTGGDLPVEDFVTLLRNAARLHPLEPLGLMIGRHCNIITLGPVGAAMAIAPTIREGLQALESFAQLHAGNAQVKLHSGVHQLEIESRYVTELGDTEPYHAESAALLIQQYLETVHGEPLQDIRFHFNFPEPEYAKAYRTHLHGQVSFNHEYNAIVLSQQHIDSPSPYYNAELWQQAQFVLAEQIRKRINQRSDTYTQHLRALMRSSETPLPTLTGVAKRLHVSERTLNRRLREESSSFREIRGEVLNQRARQYLIETDHSVEAVAATLGYQDAANFRRAFRRSEGCSPAAFRRRSA